MRRYAVCGVALVATAVLVATKAISQNTQQKEAKKSAAKQQAEPIPDMQEMMKKWMEVATPGEPHKKLEPLVGSWDTTLRMWMGGPASPPTETKGSSEARWILDGRFLLEESSGQMLGMPYHGMGITGYDNFKKKYVGCWIDNMGTALYTNEGTLNQAGDTITSYGQMDEFLTGEHDKMVKYVSRITSKDKHVFEVYDLSIGDDAKVVEITYTRKPAAE